MKRTCLLLALALLMMAPALRAGETSYGAGVTLDETLKISSLLADPDHYVGKKVRVEGMVTEVCQMAGCWMELEESAQAKIRVKVDDGAIVFPATASGKKAVAEGVVESIPMTREKYVAYMQHEAEETGKKFDPAAIGDGPFQILQLRGTGARILGQ